MYMSYCRFEGTRGELGVCISEVMDHVNEEAEYEVDEREIGHFRGMVIDFFNMLQETGIIDPCCDINEDAMDGVCEKMKQAFTEEDWQEQKKTRAKEWYGSFFVASGTAHYLHICQETGTFYGNTIKISGNN